MRSWSALSVVCFAALFVIGGCAERTDSPEPDQAPPPEAPALEAGELEVTFLNSRSDSNSGIGEWELKLGSMPSQYTLGLSTETGDDVLYQSTLDDGLGLKRAFSEGRSLRLRFSTTEHRASSLLARIGRSLAEGPKAKAQELASEIGRESIWLWEFTTTPPLHRFYGEIGINLSDRVKRERSSAVYPHRWLGGGPHPFDTGPVEPRRSRHSYGKRVRLATWGSKGQGGHYWRLWLYVQGQ